MALQTALESGSGFAHPVASSQAIFRCVMNALARPGSVQAISDVVKTPSPLMPATAAIALSLFDHDTSIWLDRRFAAEADIANWLRFQTGAVLTGDPSQATFALIHDGAALPDFDSFALGTPEYPDRSTTLVIQVETLTAGPELMLSGPGIRGTSAIKAGALPPDFAARMQANRALFPLGVDLLLVCGSELVALPRSVHVNAGEA
jgi:alpha-D-ribose 1-methylphosphonate 5-triphosphate synthase subunit PhnH